MCARESHIPLTHSMPSVWANSADFPATHLQVAPPTLWLTTHHVVCLILREVYRVTESLQREKSGLLKQLDFLRCMSRLGYPGITAPKPQGRRVNLSVSCHASVMRKHSSCERTLILPSPQHRVH